MANITIFFYVLIVLSLLRLLMLPMPSFTRTPKQNVYHLEQFEEPVSATPSEDNRIFPVVMYTNRYIAKYYITALLDATVRFKERIRTQRYTDTTDMNVKLWRPPRSLMSRYVSTPKQRISGINKTRRDIIDKVQIGLNKEFNLTPHPIKYSKYITKNTFIAPIDPSDPSKTTRFTSYFFEIKKHPFYAIHKYYHTIEPTNTRKYIMYITIGNMPNNPNPKPNNNNVTFHQIPVDIGILGSDNIYAEEGECIRKDKPEKGALNVTYKRDCWALGGLWVRDGFSPAKGQSPLALPLNDES